MRKISVILDDLPTRLLENAVIEKNCTISDIVNSAIIAFLKDEGFTIYSETPVYDEIFTKIGNVDAWCRSKSIDKNKLIYVIKRSIAGHSITGFGNTKNKWRDKQDGRIFKTHTAWIAHCLKEDFGIDLTS